jgi:hypothetical protein
VGRVVRCPSFLDHFLLDIGAHRVVRPGRKGRSLLIALWSATGGSGTSVFTAACAIVLARDAGDNGHGGGVRLADLAGDLPAIFGRGSDPEVGLADWLAAGPEAPTDALDRLLVEVAPRIALLPRGGVALTPALAAPESGAALAVALASAPSPVLVDCGTAREPALQAVLEVADVVLVVLRSCYLSLRRAVNSPCLSHTTGVVLLDESERTLGANQIGDVLDLPVLARIGIEGRVARAVDAGVLSTRLPDALARPARDVLRRIGVRGGRRGEAA